MNESNIAPTSTVTKRTAESGAGTVPTVSAIIISYNEADVIEPCLRSVVDWVDEIVVVDMHSTDNTREIAHRYGARVVDHERLTYADPARDFALAQASGDWIIMLDPDERIPERLAIELRSIARRGDVDVVDIPYQQIMFGRSVRSPGASEGSHPRFFRRGMISWPAQVHAWPSVSHLRRYNIPAGDSGLSIHHDTWRTVSTVLDKIVRYAPKDVERLRAQGEHFSPHRLIRVTIGGLANRLVDGRVYEDGVPGLLTALYWAVYDLSIEAEMWEAENRPTYFDASIARWGRRAARAYRLARLIKRGLDGCRVIVRALYTLAMGERWMRRARWRRSR
jgi:glycosyltransferase involved in cell wall biosynthesis